MLHLVVVCIALLYLPSEVYAEKIRIINGHPSKLGQFPWQAGILYTRNNRKAFCGGSLIHPQWIMTAAHCIHNGYSHRIRLGTTKSLDDNQPSLQLFKPIRIQFHEQFDRDTFSNDIALIKLDRTVTINEFVKPIVLSELQLFPNLTVSGWGKTEDIGAVVHDLNYAQVEMIPEEQCQLYYDLKISNEMVCCVGKLNENACSGDSGGPLVQFTKEKGYQQVGIVSFGTYKNENETLCEIGNPTVYIRTGNYIKWVQEKIN